MNPAIEEIMRTGTPSPHAMVIATSTGHRFACYRTGVNRYARVCPELDAILRQPGDGRETFGASVGGKGLGKRFRFLRTVLKAIELEAIKQGIMRSDGTLIRKEAANAPQA